MTARIAPAIPPFAAPIASIIDQISRGAPPLTLFATLARDERLASKFFASNLLDRGHLALRDRELVIDRVTALCGSEYEWGVHVAIFGKAAGFSEQQIESLACGGEEDACWNEHEITLLNFCDALQRDCTLDDALWSRLKVHFCDEALIELLMLAGLYRTVSYITNALRIPLEPFARRFPAAARPAL